MDVEEGRRKVTAICRALPEVEFDSRTGQHTGYTVRGKPFAWYLVDHHGDGRIAFSCRLSLDTQHALVAAQPERFSVAPYVGRYGWIVLDLEETITDFDWTEVAALALESYCIVAPKKLAVAAAQASPGDRQPL